MPAGTNRSVGSSAMSDADGTTVWPRSSKKRRKRRRISADLIGLISLLVPVLQLRSVQTQCLPELVFALCGIGLDLAPPRGDAFARASSLRGEPLRRPLV